MVLREYEYHSHLKPYIEEFVQQKRINGYSYEIEAYVYTKFDDYCIDNNLSVHNLTKESLQNWMLLRPGESKGYCGQRISFVQQLLIFINSQGIPTYIPHNFTVREKHVPHILSDAEIEAFFFEADHNNPRACTPTCDNAKIPVAFLRLADEYKILFRLIYCCGLRNAEACNLRSEDVDLDAGTLMIIHSKGDKDRVVYLHENMKMLMGKYIHRLKAQYDCESGWIFPGKYEYQHVPKTSVDRKFNEFWSRTSFAANCDKKPTVHSLRHTFVVKRMNLWMENGISLNLMMPYLSKYLGHKGRGETFYYYHQVDTAFRIVEQKDRRTKSLIPEVRVHE